MREKNNREIIQNFVLKERLERTFPPGFTVAELLVVVLVIGILATVSFASYRSMKADAETRVCESRLRALQAALNTCAMERDVSAYCLAPSGSTPFLTNIALDNSRYISCPADDTSPEKLGAAASYGYNTILDGISSQEYQKLPADLIIIGDCDSASFSTNSDSSLPLEKRHSKIALLTTTKLALGITKGFQEDKGKFIKSITAANEACHAKYQNCLRQAFDDNKDKDASIRAAAYVTCASSSLGEECSGDYE